MDVAVKKFLQVIASPGRSINLYIAAMAKAEFRKRLEWAAKGALAPISEVKPLEPNPPPIFEIRWQGITIQDTQSDGRVQDLRLVVRMYHSEPDEFPNHFIGHHIHEKDLSDPTQIKIIQEGEIRVARNYYWHGQKSRWGLGFDKIH